MSIEKIAELNKLAQQMEEMKIKAMSEITDRRDLRVQALYKIQDYLRQISKATEGFSWSAETPISIYWLVKQNDVGKNYNRGVTFYFKPSGIVEIYQNASASALKIYNFTNLTEEDFYYTSGNQLRWNEGFVPLVENWKEIKPYIESSAEKALLERMNKTQKELADFKASYEKVVNFEV